MASSVESASSLDAVAIDVCFLGLDTVGPLLLAVSGGPDSMALMHMAAAWVATLPLQPPLHVATVDHRLRPEAAAEAAMVAEAAATLGLPHAVLPWGGAKPATRIQERARAARYALLVAHAAKIGATHVLAAHHADDQAETVLMRLGRGSGIGGLAGMRRLTPLAPGVTLARPLLDIPKAEFVAYCAAHGIATVDDPSNRNERFARARLRAAAPALAALGLDRPGLSRLSRRMARADAALEAETDRVERSLGPAKTVGSYRATLDDARDLQPEIALRLLQRAVGHVAPRPVIRLDRLEALADRLRAALAEGRGHRGTLAGTRVTLDRHAVLEVAVETSRRRGLKPDSGRD